MLLAGRGASGKDQGTPMASVPAAARQAAYRNGRALPPASPGGEPGFPIQDADHWDKARQAVGRVRDPGRRAALAKLLRKTAPRFGKTKALGQSWAAPGGASMAGDGPGIDLAMRAMLSNGQMLTCPECGHVAPAGDFGTSGASLQKSPQVLRTPAPATGGVRHGAATAVRAGSAAHALANAGQALELAGTLTGRRYPVSGPLDVIVARGDGGNAVIRHRRGGAEVASLRKNGDGTWTATVAGKDLAARAHQRTALMEAVGTYNKALTGGLHPLAAPLQPPPQQTPLMQQYGIPAIRALATPAAGAGAGPRVTLASSTYDPDHDGDDDGSPSGDTDHDYAGALTAKGRAIYRRLCARGLPKPRALALAKRAQAMGGKAA